MQVVCCDAEKPDPTTKIVFAKNFFAEKPKKIFQKNHFQAGKTAFLPPFPPPPHRSYKPIVGDDAHI
ncbi:MAG: hypothetical protein IIY02_02380, partial [Firmicutes bacterium]|nr:hypothetical protein [Bacillota bacterium]